MRFFMKNEYIPCISALINAVSIKLFIGLVFASTILSSTFCMESISYELESAAFYTEVTKPPFSLLLKGCFVLPNEVIASIVKNYLELALREYEEGVYYCESTESEDSDFPHDAAYEEDRVMGADERPHKSYTSNDIEKWKRLEPYVCYLINTRCTVKVQSNWIEIILQEALLLCNQGCSPVHGAVRVGNLPQAVVYLFLYLSDSSKRGVYDECIFGKTPLVALVESGSLLGVSVLTSLGAPLHTLRGKRSPFFAALKYSNTAMLKLLLDRGANINERTKKRKSTALHVTIASKNHELLDRLLDWGASTETANVYGETPLLYALTLHYEPAIALLLGRGANPNAQNRGKKSGLDLLCDDYKKAALHKEYYENLWGVDSAQTLMEPSFDQTMEAVKRCMALLMHHPHITLTEEHCMLFAHMPGLSDSASLLMANTITGVYQELSSKLSGTSL